jgi:hypothetical protein
MADPDWIGVSAIGTDLIVIDEIATMELTSQRFIRAVEEALASDKDMACRASPAIGSSSGRADQGRVRSDHGDEG